MTSSAYFYRLLYVVKYLYIRYPPVIFRRMLLASRSLSLFGAAGL